MRVKNCFLFSAACALPFVLFAGVVLGGDDGNDNDGLQVRALVKEPLTVNALGRASLSTVEVPGFRGFDTLLVSDIGSTEQDGVSIDLSHDAARWSAVMRDESGDGDALRGTVEIHAIGVVDDVPDQLATILRIESFGDGNLITADFSPIGSDQQQILVLLGESIVAHLTDLSTGSGTQTPDFHVPITWCQLVPEFFECCGNCFRSGAASGDLDLSDCRYEVQFGAAIPLVLPNGETVVGDRLVIAEDEGPDSIDMRIFSEMRVLLADQELFSISDQRVETVDDAEDQVCICHIPPGNPANAHTICIDESAVPAHLEHGDTLEPCSPRTGFPQTRPGVEDRNDAGSTQELEPR